MFESLAASYAFMGLLIKTVISPATATAHLMRI